MKLGAFFSISGNVEGVEVVQQVTGVLQQQGWSLSSFLPLLLTHFPLLLSSSLLSSLFLASLNTERE